MASEADALSNILEWSKSRPEWQQYALYQLYTSGLSEIDIDKCSRICKGEITNTEYLSNDDINSPENATKVK